MTKYFFFFLSICMLLSCSDQDLVSNERQFEDELKVLIMDNTKYFDDGYTITLSYNQINSLSIKPDRSTMKGVENFDKQIKKIGSELPFEAGNLKTTYINEAFASAQFGGFQHTVRYNQLATATASQSSSFYGSLHATSTATTTSGTFICSTSDDEDAWGGSAWATTAGKKGQCSASAG